MFDVYLSDRRDQLLVVETGQPIPIDQHLGRWYKKRAAVAVSDEIKTAVQRDGPTIREGYEREPQGSSQGVNPVWSMDTRTRRAQGKTRKAGRLLFRLRTLILVELFAEYAPVSA